MSLNTAQLWQSIQENGIASAAECREWANIIVESTGMAALNDPQLLLAQLIKLKKITPFQANAFLSNSLQTLTIGRHRLLAPLTSPALSNWFEAIDPASNAARWIYAIPSDRLLSEDLTRHPPSLLYSKKQASVKGDSLQSMSPPAMFDGYLLVAATPAPGRPLRDGLKQYHHNVLPNEKSMKIIFSLAIALADLHEQGVVHGRIGIDQVWWDGADQVTLLRDPFFPPVSPLSMNVPVAVGVSDDQDFRIRYAAPEFTAPGQQPTPATDMYSLGCLWWELISGRLPYWDTMLDKVPTSACLFPLVIPQETVISQGQRKCLEYLLAKTPTTRFQSGREFLNAFKVVVPKEWLPAKEPSVVAEPNVPIETKQSIPPGSKPVVIAESITDKVEVAKATVKPVVKPSADPKPTRVEATNNRSVAKPREVDLASKPDLTTKSIRPSTPTKKEDIGVDEKGTTSVPIKSPRPKVETPPKIISETIPTPASVSIPETVNAPTTIPAITASVPTLKTLPISPSIPRLGGKPVQRRKKKKPIWLLPSLIGGGLACLSILAWALSGSTSKSRADPSKDATENAVVTDEAASPNAESNPTKAGEALPGRLAIKPRQDDPLLEQFVFASGENSFPWLPPRANQPYSLEMLPPGLQGLLIVRPKLWLEEGIGSVTTSALLPAIANLWEPVQKATGMDASNTEQIAIALYGGRDDGWPESVYRIKLNKPTTVVELKQKWTNYTEQPAGDKNHLWASGSEAIFTHPGPVDEDREISQFTWGPISLIRDLAEVDGNGAAITRSLEELWKASDVQSDFTLLLSTNFLFSTARSLLPMINPRVNEFLRDKLSEKTLGIALSTTIANAWYGELRILGREGPESAKLLDEIRVFAKDLSEGVEKTLVQTPAQEYWRALALRYPQMLRALDKHSRYGLENGQIVANFYLPNTALPNLAIASWLMMQPSSFLQNSVTSIASSTAPPPAKPSAFSLLEHPVTINFEQEPLDSALGLVSEELNSSLPANVHKVTLSIDGKAFELSSVTRNQQIRNFKFTKAPFRNLLTDLASRVNPDKTITSIKDLKQAVVWVVGGKPDAPEIIFTTRRGIEGTDQKLPEEFVSP